MWSAPMFQPTRTGTRSARKHKSVLSFSFSTLLWNHLRLFSAVDQQVGSGHQEDGDDDGNSQSANDGAGKRRVLFTARLKGQGHWDHAEDGREGSHQHRP